MGYLHGGERMVRTIHVRLEDAEYERLNDAKDGRTWREVLIDGADA